MIAEGRTICKCASEHMVRVTVDNTKGKIHTYFSITHHCLWWELMFLSSKFTKKVYEKKLFMTNGRLIFFPFYHHKSALKEQHVTIVHTKMSAAVQIELEL